MIGYITPIAHADTTGVSSVGCELLAGAIDGDDAKVFEAYEQWRRDMDRVYGMAELIVAKQRHGATGKVKMRFDSRVTKFSDAVDDNYLPEIRS